MFTTHMASMLKRATPAFNNPDQGTTTQLRT